jgi:hypothetical protein
MVIDMITFNNLSQVEQYIMKQLEESMRILSNDIKSMIKEYINNNLYQRYYPHEYQRTGQFLDCLDVRVIRKGNSVEAEIFFNTDYIDMNEVEDSKWNQHMSVDGSETWNGASVSEWIPYFMEYGTHNSLWDRDGLHSMETIQKEIENTKYHLKELMTFLKARGVNCIMR